MLTAELIDARGSLLNPVLRSFWTAKRNAAGERIRNRVLYGGRSSSKTWDAAGFAIWLAQNFTLKFLCVRQFQNRIDDSVYTILKNTIDRYARARKTTLGEWQILENKIRHRKTGTEFVFYGLARNIREIKGLEGIDICWIEEAEALTEDQWKILNPTLRNDLSQFWIIFNPHLSTDFVWKRFVSNPLPGTLVREINYVENPFLSQTMRDVIAADFADDPEEAEHIYLGVPKDDDDDAVIKRSWIMSAIDAHIRLGFDVTGSNRLGFDVADSGKDKCASVHAHGALADWADLWKAREDELLKSSARAWNAAGIRGAQLVYDSIGVGAQVGANVNLFNVADEHGRPSTMKVQHQGFNAGGAVWRPDGLYGMTRKPNKDMFANIKAQAWWLVADRFRNTFNAIRELEKQIKEGLPQICKFDQSELIFISSDIPYLRQIIDELATPKRDYDNTGKVKVESKRDLAKANRVGGPVPSPNLADAFIMCFAPTARPMVISPEALRAA